MLWLHLHGMSRNLNVISVKITHVYECIAYLLIKLVDDALRPLKVKIFVLQWPINISQLDAHLADQKPVILIGPVDT